VTLSYCLNVHPGESLEAWLALLRGPVARVRQVWSPHEPMGVGLWLPREIARALAHDDAALAQAQEALSASDLFAFTVNAFPIGGFHANQVKRAVYRPTWSQPERLDYTVDVFRALARLLEPYRRGSVSTVPVSYKAFQEDDAALDEAARNLARAALEAERLEAETGRSLALALEPEPLATLETTDEAIEYLQARVFAGPGREVLVASGVEGPDAEAVLRRRIGVCVDTCHLACQFEDLTESLTALARAGVTVPKAQLSSALELRDPGTNAAGRRRLRGFHEPRYLHQSVALREGATRRAEDLPELLDTQGELLPGFADAERVRTHFHVPLCWDGDGELGTTRADLEAGLHALAVATDHLEVETYTFDVLPAADRARYGDDVVAMVVAELRWAEAALDAATR
jgi:hypothetical protein